MAKNKNKNKNSKNTDNESKTEVKPEAAVPPASTVASSPPATDALPSAATTAQAPADDVAAGSSSSTAVDNMTEDQLKSEVLVLRQQLATKEAEIAQLKTELFAAKPTLPAGAKIPDVEQLKERLANLKKDQEDADKARDTAWAQLKNVVGEIQKLANPDYVNSLVQNADGGNNQAGKSVA